MKTFDARSTFGRLGRRLGGFDLLGLILGGAPSRDPFGHPARPERDRSRYGRPTIQVTRPADHVRRPGAARWCVAS